jgi:hypothetical protein
VSGCRQGSKRSEERGHGAERRPAAALDDTRGSGTPVSDSRQTFVRLASGWAYCDHSLRVLNGEVRCSPSSSSAVDDEVQHCSGEVSAAAVQLGPLVVNSSGIDPGPADVSHHNATTPIRALKRIGAAAKYGESRR